MSKAKFIRLAVVTMGITFATGSCGLGSIAGGGLIPVGIAAALVLQLLGQNSTA